MASEGPQPDDLPESGSDFIADAQDRIDDARTGAARSRVALSARARFALVVLAVVLAHAALIAAFLWRDRNTTMQLASSEETPIEVIIEKPPEPPAPLPPPPPPPPPPPEKKPPPPPPKEDLSPAFSAPRKENQETVKTDKLQDKTSAPKTPQPPQEGTPQPKAAAAPPKEAAPPTDAKEEAAGKQDDTSKPEAEALDKASPKSPKLPTSKPPKAKTAKASPKTNQKTTRDVLASLSAPSTLPQMSFSKPAAATKVYGGTEDVRWMSTVEGLLEAKVGTLPRTQHWQAGGHVVICFHVDVNGRVAIKDFCQKSGYPDVDQIAMRALMAAQPFPPPPPGVEHGLAWSSVFDGQLPTVHVSKR